MSSEKFYVVDVVMYVWWSERRARCVIRIGYFASLALQALIKFLDLCFHPRDDPR